MADSSDPPHPPADPRPARRGAPRAMPERPRVELAAALFLGVVLIASGLYLWRRPHTPAVGTASDPPSPSPSLPLADDGGTLIASADGGAADPAPSPITVSGARVVGCHDRGPKKTPADRCDRLVSIEKAFANAVEQSAACVPQSVNGGTIEYVADVSFLRHRVSVVLPRAGRSVRDRKVIVGCAAAVRTAMGSVPLDGVGHEHARYTISLTATYRGGGRGG
jgi:hypothetical protein